MGIITELLIEFLESKSKSKNVRKHHRSNSRTAVRRDFTSLWQERKWHKAGGLYLGYFRTPFGSYQGQIVEHYQGYGRYYIFNPPSCLSRHSHFACFIPKEGSKYEVHFSKRANSVDEGIMAIEKILCEAHQL